MAKFRFQKEHCVIGKGSKRKGFQNGIDINQIIKETQEAS
jgi:hypothetical protein